MGFNSGISWCDHTINFWTGCTKVSPGCKFCYMYRNKERFNTDPTVVMQTKMSTIMSTLRKVKPGEKIFTCSWSDFFIEGADEWREWAWDIIRQHPQFVWQILTKRPERIKDCLPADWGDGWPQVWLGVSAENQEYAAARIPALLLIPANVRFVSYEPALGPIDLSNIQRASLHTDSLRGVMSTKNAALSAHIHTPIGKIHWVIIGGESGNTQGKYLYRPAELSWFEDVVAQCKAAGTAVWVKQMGTHLQKQLGLKATHGTDIAEFPDRLQVQQFPGDWQKGYVI